MASDLLKHIDRSVLPPAGGKVLVSLSGGADSVALLVGLRELGYDCRAAHCNFHLRGAASDSDEAFVRELCGRLGLPLDVKGFDDVPGYARGKGISIEMACRELRLEWTLDLREKHGCECIAIAHHQEDNVETFLLNALRGSGVTGLGAMRARNGFLARPMLNATREEIERYLARKGIGFVVDATNAESDVRRNKLRNILIPELKRLFPDSNLELTVRAMDSCREFYLQAIDEAASQCTGYRDDVAVIDLDKVKSHKGADALMVAIAARYGFNADIALSMLANRRKGARFVNERFEAVMTATTVEIAPRGSGDEPEEYDFHLTDTSGLPIELRAELVIAPVHFERDPLTLWLDATEIARRPLRLRHWRPGDSIAPFGMNGRRRKLSDIFNDIHLSLVEKQRLWILEIEGEILWIVGVRASCHFRCTAGEWAYRVTVKPRQ